MSTGGIGGGGLSDARLVRCDTACYDPLDLSTPNALVPSDPNYQVTINSTGINTYDIIIDNASLPGFVIPPCIPAADDYSDDGGIVISIFGPLLIPGFPGAYPTRFDIFIPAWAVTGLGTGGPNFTITYSVDLSNGRGSTYNLARDETALCDGVEVITAARNTLEELFVQYPLGPFWSAPGTAVTDVQAYCQTAPTADIQIVRVCDPIDVNVIPAAAQAILTDSTLVTAAGIYPPPANLRSITITVLTVAAASSVSINTDSGGFNLDPTDAPITFTFEVDGPEDGDVVFSDVTLVGVGNRVILTYTTR